MSPRKAPTNPAASVRARLLNLAHARNEEFQLILSDFATERFLYRLSASAYAERFVLKGAMLLRLWSPERYRATWDVDLLGRRLASAEAISTALREICAIPAEDGLVFVPESLVVEDIREAAEHGGVRVRLVWDLAGAKIPMQVDVAVGESVVPEPRIEPYPTLLDHPAPRVLAYPRETVVAEKLEAVLSLGPTNSRMKDYYDLRLLASRFDFKGAVLLAAVRATFEHRGTASPPAEPVQFTREYLMAPERQALWKSFWRRARPHDAPESVEQMADALQNFLGPGLQSTRSGRWFARELASGRTVAMSGARASEAVVRRNKPYPAYKDSGVEWLGTLPDTRGMKRLKRMARFHGGRTPQKDHLECWRGDIPWVSPKDMKVSVIVDTEDKITAQAVR